MPLEIRELVIRTAVTGENRAGPAGQENSGLSEASKASIIAACIEQVLAILKARSER